MIELRNAARAVIVGCLFAAAASCGSSTPEGRLEEARAALAEADYRTAEIHLQNVLMAEPDNASARRMLGEVSLALGNASGAEAQLRRALELGAAPAELQLSLLRALLAQRKFEAVLEQAEDGPALEAADAVQALRIEGSAHEGLGETAAAEAAYRAALARDPESPAVRADLANLYVKAGRSEEASALLDEVLGDAPEFAPALVVRSRLEVQSGDLPAAEATLREIMRLEGPSGPSYFPALAQLVEVTLARGRPEEAAMHADELLASAPESPAAQYLKARTELALDQTDSAERRLEGVIASTPDYFPANRLLGMINAEQGQLGQAEMYLQAAVGRLPDDPIARSALAQAYLRQGKIEPARELLAASFPTAQSDAVMLALAGGATRRAGDDGRAAEYFDESERALPEDPQALFGLATVYAAAGEYERAVRVLQSAEPGDTPNATLASYLLTMTYLAQGDLEAAAAESARLTELSPDAAWPLAVQGTVAARAGNLEEARGRYTAALEIDPDHVPTLMNLARAEILMGERERAARTLRRVASLEPSRTPALLGLAELAIARGSYDEARDWLEGVPESAGRLRVAGRLAAAEGDTGEAAELLAQAFERQPSAESALLAYRAARRAGRPEPEAPLVAWLGDHPLDAGVNFALGSEALARGDFELAVERFELVLRVAPDHAETLNNLAWLYQRNGDERALAMAQRAYEAAPDNPAIADTLGWLLVQRGDADAGLPYLEQATTGAPAHPEIRYHWGVALDETGDSETAVSVFEALLAQDSDFPNRPDAERRLAALRQP